MKYYSISPAYVTHVLINDDRQVLGVGSNRYGQLGNGTTQDSSVLTKTLHSGTIKTMETSYGSASMILTDEGKILSWGAKYMDGLGIGNNASCNTPQAAQGIKEPVSHIALGGFHALALTRCGKVYATGSNTLNELGMKKTALRSCIFQKIKFLAKSEVQIRLIATGHAHNFAVTAHGDLYAWGKNDRGQLGLGHKKQLNKPRRVKLDFSAKNIVSIVAGDNFSALLTQSGEVYTCGSNCEGQLGHDGEENQFKRIKNLKNIVVISAGDKHLLILNRHGQLFALGDNECYQIYPSDCESFSSPQQIIPHSVVAIHAIGNMSFILTHDGAQYHFQQWGERSFFGRLEIPGLKDAMIKQHIYDVEQRNTKFTDVKKVSRFNDACFFFSPREENSNENNDTEQKLDIIQPYSQDTRLES